MYFLCFTFSSAPKKPKKDGYLSPFSPKKNHSFAKTSKYYPFFQARANRKLLKLSMMYVSEARVCKVNFCFTSLCHWPIQLFQWTLQKWVSHHKMKHNEGCYTLDPWPAEPLVKLQQIVAEMARVRGKVHGYTGHAPLPRTWHLTHNCYPAHFTAQPPLPQL